MTEIIRDHTLETIEEEHGIEGVDAFLNLSKQEAVEILVMKLFEFDHYKHEDEAETLTDEQWSELERIGELNPSKWRMDAFVQHLERILFGENPPHDFASIHHFGKWYEKKYDKH